MIILSHEQYSPEWWAAHIGRPSVSMFGKIVTSEGKKSTSWWPTVYKFAAELNMGHLEEAGYQNEDMARGTLLEAEARDAYEFIYDVSVYQVGGVFRDEQRLWMCSPDGIYDTTGLEIKCPRAGTHTGYCFKGVLPTDYKPQVYGSLWICDELERWAFFSYHPELKPFRIIVNRQDEGYKVYSEALEKFMPEFIRNIAEVAK